MRSRLILNSPWRGTGNRNWWTFDGSDDRIIRDCLDQLDEFKTADVDDWWKAALVFSFAERTIEPPTDAWTILGALRLADLVPDSLSDVRDDLLSRFRDDPQLPQFRERLGL